MLLCVFAFILALKDRDDFIPFLLGGLVEGLLELVILAGVLSLL